MIFAVLTCFATLNDTSILKMPQARGQERTRDAREPTLDSIELQTARKQLANDQRRPAIGKDLGRTSNRTILMVCGHVADSFAKRRVLASPKKELDESDSWTSANTWLRLASHLEVSL